MDRQATNSPAPDRRETGRFIGATIALAIVIGLYAFLHSPYFAVQHILVDGARAVDAAELRELSGVQRGGNLLQVDLKAVAARLVTHPRVRHAHVGRRLPDGLVLTITEHVPVALVATTSPYAVGGDGTRVPLVAGEAESLPIIPVSDDDEAAAHPVALQVARLVPADVRPLIADVAVTDDAHVTMTARTGERVLLGQAADDMERKLAIVAQLLRTDAGQYSLIDVRFPQTPTVRTR